MTEKLERPEQFEQQLKDSLALLKQSDPSEPAARVGKVMWEIIQENKRMKEAIDLLTKPEWVEWAQNMIPNCPKWQQVRRAMGEAEIGFDDWGVYASTFVKLAAKDAL